MQGMWMRGSWRFPTLVLLVVTLAACGRTDPAPGPVGDFGFTIDPVSAYQPRGEQGVFRVLVARTTGFEGDVTLSLEDAPPGITGSGTVREGQEAGELLIVTSVDAALGPVVLNVIAEASSQSGPPLIRERMLTLTVLDAFVPRLILAGAAESALPAVIYEELVTPEEGEPWTLQLVAVSGTLLLTDDGSYEHRLLLEAHVDGELSGRERLTDRGTYNEAEGAIAFTSETIENLAFIGSRTEDGIKLLYDVYPHTGVHRLVAFEYRP